MRYFKFSICVYFILTSLLSAQNQLISLEEIWGGVFRTESMDVLHSMENGKQYSVLNFDRNTGSTSIDIYDYQTLEKVQTLVSSTNIPQLRYFVDYTFSNDEQKVLLATEVEQIYRHSSRAIYFVYDINTEEVVKLHDEKVQEPTFSPDGSKVAFALDNNLYIKDLLSGNTTQITSDGKKNSIINGVTDWVYEEEFAFVKAFDWNTDSNKIAFIRFDETDVPEFSMDVYGTALYPQQYVFKYPKAGENNSKVSIHMYDLETNKSHEIKVKNTFDDFYIPKLKWTNSANNLCAIYLNRHQNEAHIWLINTVTKQSEIILTEKDEAYIEEGYPIHFLKDNTFLWISETDGYNHIYHYSEKGKLINQVTMGSWEVTEYYGFDEKTQRIFYQSVENGSINRDVYSVKLNGRNKKRLTKNEGTNSASFSADFSYFINAFSNATTPPKYTLNSADSGNLIKGIKDNDRLLQELSNYKISKKEFSTINVNGNDLNMWMIKPANFDDSKQYPLLMYQYSGPGSQSAANSWHSYNDYWYQHLAQQGYIIACVDGRGTGFKGADFKKVTYLNLVKYETEDQIEVAKKLGELPYVDADRIGIWGWSYGGHMSTNCLLKGNDVFKMAIAVAPVTSWRFYDTIYTERFMRTPQENPDGYDDNSPFNYPEMLKGDYLLVHGSGDDNVHVQHTMRMVEALIQANKDFDWAIYPDKNHGIYGGNTRLHLFRKMTNFIHENLGDKREFE
ncbi:S9 family peptidase [Seonamhaeicola aphaedonensis]|uniref:Dipeptidyl-peptidase-4 n=1 Tax=Seonamhaeicola aphaedonensis TaxID=1461338 RepID=A0A3D9HMS0_9FLAO|nr:S9 family peptidase [Seonamhaeicola aphaedonensis]RED50196.1 dipeptidyl-peptidase-4 [Seonamhaeicola aphaedonensis]